MQLHNKAVAIATVQCSYLNCCRKTEDSEKQINDKKPKSSFSSFKQLFQKKNSKVASLDSAVSSSSEEHEQNVSHLEPAPNTLSVANMSWRTQISVHVTVGKITPVGLVSAHGLVSTQFIQHQRRLLSTRSHIYSEIFAVNIITTAVIPKYIISAKSQLEIIYGNDIATQIDDHKMALKSILKSEKQSKNPQEKKKSLSWAPEEKLAHYRLIPKRVRARAVPNNAYTFKETGFIPRSEYAIVLTVQKQLVYKIYPRSNRTKTRCPGEYYRLKTVSWAPDEYLVTYYSN
ncbi:hypothetical protein CDAR_102721 [Caerostris darwini]|uniref:Uncharacterized protein n=1 Tax=Caerostris darwini TaxID=1538125 RepID=A0AAV4WNL6_9ARAC|nr:hypothetical protein CDAR_102721 [Caerostris darwini]